MSDRDREQLQAIKTFPSLVKYLRDELDWPIDADDFDDLTFDYEPEELGIDAKTAAKIDQIKQLRPLVTGQPWGVFFVKFEPKRLPVVALRRILSQLVIRKRASARKAEQAFWNLHDLLFISNYGEGDQRQITFAHFGQEEGTGDLPTLKVLGWDDADTALHIDHVHKELKEHLHWPDDEADLKGWRQCWSSAFTLRHREVITTSKALSIRLAQLATDIRKRVNTVLRFESEKGPLRKLHAAFKEALIHDLSEDDFADMYAQTITYGLLSARVSRPAGLVAENIAEMVPVTNPFLRDLLSTFLTVGGRKGKIDFDEVGINDVVQTLRDANMEAVLRDFGDRNPQEDPVVHFYELFLKEYDPKKRLQRGVFYTPRPVVSFIVRSVHEILHKEFGLPDGMADTATWGEMLKKHKGLAIPKGAKPTDPFVQILDPACGTGTFLVEVIDVIYKTMKAAWLKAGHTEMYDIPKLWNEYVADHLLPRLYGFELMMAPYAVAHMKVGLKLHETGYNFRSHERARIYLTNSLEEPHDFSDRFEFDAPALAHEAQAVNAIKRNKRFTVVIGNPPYSHLSSNLTAIAMAMVEPYKFVRGERIQERGALSLQKNLQDDYIKFIRFAETSIEKAFLGIVGLITNNSYLDSRSFRGMRFHLTQTFPKGWILDLHGSGKKSERVGAGASRDANVFDIVQGVGISLWLKPPGSARTPALKRADMLGPRESKYHALCSRSVSDTDWQQVELVAPFFSFVLQDVSRLREYERYSSIRDVFPIYSSGVKTHRDAFAYAFGADELRERLGEFCDRSLPDEGLRERYGLKDTNAWGLSVQRRRCHRDELNTHVRQCIYRPFDIRWTCFSNDILELTRRAVMDQMLSNENVALLCSQQQAEEGFRHAFCTRLISDWGAVSNRTRESTSAFPLFIHRSVRKSLAQHDLDLDHGPTPNVGAEWLKAFGEPAAIFAYTYAVLHAPSYRTRYGAFLRTDFPRIPLTSSMDLFRALARLGDELVALHLMESPRLNKPITKWRGETPSGEVQKVSYADDTVWIDKAQTEGFRGVPEAVWNFHIGGYQVCQKWLKDRKGRQLSADDIAHYQKIVVALAETIRLMAEIDKTIDAHGGWPGAFITDPKVLEGSSSGEV